MPKKKDMKSALDKTLKSEEDAVRERKNKIKSRFDTADKVFEAEGTETKVAVLPKPARKEVKRETYTMPEDDLTLIDKTQDRYLEEKKVFNKSEVVRIALHVLDRLPREQLIEAGNYIEIIKKGRPR